MNGGKGLVNNGSSFSVTWCRQGSNEILTAVVGTEPKSVDAANGMGSKSSDGGSESSNKKDFLFLLGLGLRNASGVTSRSGPCKLP